MSEENVIIVEGLTRKFSVPRASVRVRVVHVAVHV